jgi:dihydrofolate reductase
MIGIIAAVTQNGVIGIDGKLPFNYPEDMKHFRKTTADSVVIMGRKTFESIGKPLPKRRNIVVSKIARGLGILNTNGIEVAQDVHDALHTCINGPKDIWFIGGASIYEEAMKYADRIILTITPDYETSKNAIRFPWINPDMFKLMSVEPMTQDLPSTLRVATYFKTIARS